MSKSVMLSIRPKWCDKIARGEKTIEVRKTRPKLETPFKCYIYCTQASVRYQTICGCHVLNSDELYRHPEHGIKHGDSIELMLCENYTKDNFLNGKVIGEFTCERIALIAYDGGELSSTTNAAFSPATCLTQSEIIAYIGDKGRCYGWHMSNLRIYDTPRELSEFRRATDPCDSCHAEYTWECTGCKKLSGDIKRAPQSWCYVEEM